MKKYFLFFILSATGLLYSQVDNEFPALNDGELIKSGDASVRILQSKYFDGTSLWGHIDGGADLYLEYGFDKLLFQEAECNGIKFRIEYYKMWDAESAFGIFSVSRFKCSLSDTLTKYICITDYQVQAALGMFYISIANDKGTSNAKELAILLFKNILNKSDEKTFALPDPFDKPNFSNYIDEVKLFKGPLGIQNGMPLWIELFDNISNYEITVVDIEINDGYLDFARVKFFSAKDRTDFMRRINLNPRPDQTRYKTWKNGIFYIVKLISENEIFFCETVFNDAELKNLLGEQFP